MTSPRRTTDALPPQHSEPDPIRPSAKLATPDEVAQFLDIDTDRLSKLRVSGSGPEFVRIDRSIRYVWGDVFRWVRSNRYRSTAQRAADAVPESPISETSER